RRAGDGRYRPDPCLRGHRDRRHRLHSRRIPRGADRRAGRYSWPLLLGRHSSPCDVSECGTDRRPRAVVDAHLCLDGAHSLVQAKRPVSGSGQMTGAAFDLPRRLAVRVDLVAICIFAVLALVPILGSALNDTYLIGLFTRVIIFSIAAISLTFLIGFAG